MMRMLKSARLAIPAIFLLASPVCAQKAPDRQAVRSGVEAHREKTIQAAAIFLDRSRSDDQRAAAVAGVTAFLEKEQVEGAIAVFRNESESGRIRALALSRIPHALAQNDQILTDVLRVIRSSTAPLILRQTSLRILQEMLFSSMPTHARHQEVVAALRETTRDQNPSIREAAFNILASHGDETTQKQLLEGLESKKGVLPPYDSVRLLGLHPRSEMYPVLHQLLLSPPDERTKVECLRLLGGYEPSRKTIVEILQNPRESTAVRQAALATLNANDAEHLAVHALPVIADEKAGDSLRAYGILAVQQRRTSQKMVLSGTDEFEVAVRKLARDSGSVEVREAARRYLQEMRQK
jgi:hypothetical protein